jgi:glutaredoxin
MKERELVVFTIYGCEYYNELKDGLDKKGIRYRNIDVSKNDDIGDMIESTYKCTKYPMIALHSPDRVIIWLPETDLLLSVNIKIYDTIKQLIKEIENEFNS